MFVALTKLTGNKSSKVLVPFIFYKGMHQNLYEYLIWTLEWGITQAYLWYGHKSFDHLNKCKHLDPQGWYDKRRQHNQRDNWVHRYFHTNSENKNIVQLYVDTELFHYLNIDIDWHIELRMFLNIKERISWLIKWGIKLIIHCFNYEWNLYSTYDGLYNVQ